MLRSSYIPLRAQASPSMVCMLPPFIVCKQEEEEAFYCFRELQRRMTRDLGDPLSAKESARAFFFACALRDTKLPEQNAQAEGQVCVIKGNC